MSWCTLKPCALDGRVVRVRLHGMAELALELAAELGERRMLELERLEDDRRAALELRRDPLDLGALPENEVGVHGMSSA